LSSPARKNGPRRPRLHEFIQWRWAFFYVLAEVREEAGCIVWAWIMTIPAAASIAAIAYKVLS